MLTKGVTNCLPNIPVRHDLLLRSDKSCRNVKSCGQNIKFDDWSLRVTSRVGVTNHVDVSNRVDRTSNLARFVTGVTSRVGVTNRVATPCRQEKDCSARKRKVRWRCGGTHVFGVFLSHSCTIKPDPFGK